MSQVLASTEAREQLPKLIEELVAHPGETFEVGRQRRREVVLVAASRYDEMVRREDAVRDLAWAAFAAERVANPTGEPVALAEARGRRRRRA
jgi:PHD/YefM family antitoxin component YafN of YafNO toxin-antitoxin module